MGRIPPTWGLPAITPVNEAWFTSGTLAVQHCATCGAVQHPPEEICHACGSSEFGYEAVRPRGTVHSFTVVHYPVNPALAEAVPYTVVLVSLDDRPAVRVVGTMPEAGAGDVYIGLPVEAYWEERTTDDGTVIRLPQWRPA